MVQPLFILSTRRKQKRQTSKSRLIIWGARGTRPILLHVPATRHCAWQQKLAARRTDPKTATQRYPVSSTKPTSVLRNVLGMKRTVSLQRTLRTTCFRSTLSPIPRKFVRHDMLDVPSSRTSTPLPREENRANTLRHCDCAKRLTRHRQQTVRRQRITHGRARKRPDFSYAHGRSKNRRQVERRASISTRLRATARIPL